MGDQPAPTVVRRGRPLVGVVEEFDAGRGLGVVVTTGAHRRFPFHATAVADGSRRIAVGTAVTFQAVAGHGGRLEARGLVPVP